jgi:hypothetical protein
MKTISTQKTLWLSVTALLTIGIILVSIFSLKNGFYEIYPYFYILPILLLAYFFPRYSVYITVILGWIYLGLVFMYGAPDIRLYSTSTAFFYFIVSIGISILRTGPAGAAVPRDLPELPGRDLHIRPRGPADP